MARIRAGILNSQTTPEPVDLDSKIYGVDGLPTKSEHMPNLNVVRTDDAVGMTPADFHNVFPFNEIVNENVPNFVEYGRWDEKYNTFDNQSHMIGELSETNYASYEHEFMNNKFPASYILGIATDATIYVKDPNNRYNYVVASGTKFGKDINFERGIYYMDNMDAYLQEMMEGRDTSYAYPVVRYGFLFIIIPMTAVTGYIYHNGTEWVRTEEAISMTDSYVQVMDEITPKQEITTESVFKTLDDNKYWRYNGGTSYTIADFTEIPIPLTPTKRIPKFYVKRGMNPDGTWFEKISKTKHDETWLCHKAFISDDDGLEKPYIYVANEIVTSTYRDLREDRGNFKVYGETEYDMFETLRRIAYASWMSTYSEENEWGEKWVIADLEEFGIRYIDSILRVDTKYEENIGTSIDGVGFSSPFASHNNMSMRVATIDTFRNAKGEGASYLNVPEYTPADGAIYHFNEIEINGNDMFKYVDIVNEHDDPNPVIRQGFREHDLGDFLDRFQKLQNNVDLTSEFGDALVSGTVLFDIPLELVAPNQEIGGEFVDLYVGTNGQLQALYDACVNETITPQTIYIVNDEATDYLGDVSGLFDFPIPLYAFSGGGEDLFIGDLTPLGMGLGLVLAKIAGVSITNNNIVISESSQVTLRDIEVAMRNGTFWKLVAQITQEPAFLEKRDSFNPTVMRLDTYTKTQSGSRREPDSVGIASGMVNFLEVVSIIKMAIDEFGLRITFLNADFFAYEVLLAPVQTRLVMLP